MRLLARVTEERHGETPVAFVEGEIDASNAGDVGVRLRSILSNRSLALVVDLAGTTYLDSAAINLLFGLAGDLGDRQQRLHLVVDPASPIARAIGITGLDAAVPTHATRAEALDATAAG